MPWNYRLFGTAKDPIHKSHLNAITGDYGCLTQFRFSREQQAEPGAERDGVVGGKAVLGTAAHESIARALQNTAVLQNIVSGSQTFDVEGVRKVLDQELEKASLGREVRWYDDDRDELSNNRALMIVGVLNDLCNHVAGVEMVEPGFIVRYGDYWLSGHIDLIYRLPGNRLGTADWKTGAQKPDPIELDHGWESGIYSAAVHDGIFLSREEMVVQALPDGTHSAQFVGGAVHVRKSRYEAERVAMETALIDIALAVEAGTREYVPTFGVFPSEIRHVHMADYVPYARASKKKVSRPEELAFYGLTDPAEVKTKPGEQRGPAWYHVRRTEHDAPRLLHQLKNVIGTIRMGRFYDSIGEKCNRCPFKEPCLNTGYGVVGAERKGLEHSLRVLGQEEMFDGLDTADSR